MYFCPNNFGIEWAGIFLAIVAIIAVVVDIVFIGLGFG